VRSWAHRTVEPPSGVSILVRAQQWSVQLLADIWCRAAWFAELEEAHVARLLSFFRSRAPTVRG